jgi:23S rRNA (adenine2503-C2)-methyltransferase
MSPSSRQEASGPLEVLGLSSKELEQVLRGILETAGEPAYRARQLRDGLYKRFPEDFKALSDVPKSLRELLGARLVLHPLEKKEERLSDDGTRKFLWARKDGGNVESVSIPDRDRRTFCISTQAGCPVGCAFCATGHGGFKGHLRPAEIVDQVASMQRITGEGPTNIVYMGMGEPLLNFASVRKSIEILTDPEQFGFGARRITVSTVGIPDGMRELAEVFPQVKLAVSLHAARNDLRSRIIPINRKYPLEDVVAAGRDHVSRTGKKITFEYILLPGVNDSRRDALGLAKIAGELPSRINLIGFNPFPGAPFEKPDVRRLLCFRSWVQGAYSGDVTIRRSRGSDIHGACGQLSLLR